jgi:hypothetical protein
VNAASVRQDGTIDKQTIADALFIAQYLVGLRDEYYTLVPQNVDILLIPDRPKVNVGEQFSVNVMVNAGPASPVGAAQVYLDFNTALLEVMSLTGGATLSEELQSSFDNGLSQIAYAAGIAPGASGDSVTSPFPLVTVTFRVIAASGQSGTNIVFAPLVPPRETKTVFDAGRTNTGQLVPINVVVE